MNKSRFEIIERIGGTGQVVTFLWCFRLLGRGGEVVMTSEGYTTRSTAVRALRGVGRAFDDARVSSLVDVGVVVDTRPSGRRGA